MQDYNYYQQIFEDTSLPFAFVDLDLLDKNIELILKRAKSTQIRIASKSIRCRAVMEYIFQQSDQFQGIMAFYGEEALYLSKNGFDDILLGYPIMDKIQIEALANQIQVGKYICFMIDHPDHLIPLEAIGQQLNCKLPVCIDLDLSIDFGPIHFGVWRSQINNMEKLQSLLDEIKAKQFIKLDGLMGYEAQIAGLGDAVTGQGFMNNAVKFLKGRSLGKIAERRTSAIKLIHENGFELKFVNGGGTGSIESTITEEGVTEVTVGSGFFNSHLFDYYSHFQLHPAAAFAIEVTRNPKPGLYTCHGGGYIASGETTKIKAPLPYLPKGMQLDKNEGAGEVQTPVYYEGKECIKIGNPLFFRHSKAGELCERFKDLYFVRDGGIESIQKTYRGDGECFL